MTADNTNSMAGPPLPRPTPMTAPFWDGCRAHELRLQRCDNCGAHRFYPSAACHKCASEHYIWVPVTGRGTVYTWTVIRRALDPVWAARVPFTVVVVAVDVPGRPLIPGTLLDCAPDAVTAEMPVEIFFQDLNDEITLPCWQPSNDR